MTIAALLATALGLVAWLAYHGAREASMAKADRERDRAFLRALVHATGGPVAVWDASGRLVAASPEYARLGLPHEAASVRSPASGICDRDGAAVPPASWPVARVLRGESFTDCQLHLVQEAKDEARALSVTGVPVTDASGRTVGGIVVARALPAVRLTGERTRRAGELQAIGLVAGGLAHDFNNTLTVVLGNAALLRQALGDRPDLLRDVDGLTEAARRATILTRRLLTLTRRDSPRVERVSPGARLRDLEPVLRRLLPSGATLDVADTSRETDVVLCDPRSFDLAIVGLVGGARDALAKGGTLRVSCDAGEFLEPQALVAERLVRVTIEGPGRLLDDGGAWRLMTELPPEGPAAGGRSAYRLERLPDGRAQVRLVLAAAPAATPGDAGAPAAG